MRRLHIPAQLQLTTARLGPRVLTGCVEVFLQRRHMAEHSWKTPWASLPPNIANCRHIARARGDMLLLHTQEAGAPGDTLARQ